jgi:hypothetical protein
MSIMNVEQAVAEHVHKEYPPGQKVPQKVGLMDRAQNALEEAAKQEEMIQSLLSRVRGSNVSHLDPIKESIPTGLPGVYDQLERRQKNMSKLIQDLSEMF